MSEEIPPRVQHELMRHQQLQEQLKALIVRRQQFELELREVEKASEELNKLAPDAIVYKSTGMLLFKTDRDKVLNELKDRKETLELHIRTLQRQESLARRQVEESRSRLQEMLRGLPPTSLGEE